MCDYSLMGVSSRLAAEGDELVTYRFGTGTIGLASVAEVNALKAWTVAQANTGAIATLKKMVTGANRPVVCAICVPPGANLGLVKNGRVSERATFDQLSEKVNNYRDAIRFNRGHATLLQNLPEGRRMNVMSLEGATEREPAREGAYALR
jgi:hypothetical protein